MAKSKKLLNRAASFTANTAIGGIKLLLKGAAVVTSGVWNISKNIVANEVEKSKKPQLQPIYSKFNTLQTIHGDFEKFEEKILRSKSSVGIILGSRGSGKSALGMRLLENAKTKGRKVQALGFSSSSLPQWIECIDSIEKVKNNAFLLVDEGGITFSSRSSMNDANKLLSQLLLISRHKDLSVIFISQNSANIDVNAIRQADYLLFKKSSLLQLDFERKKIKEIYLSADAGFKKFSSNSGLTFVYSDEFQGFTSNELPSFWSESASKSFSRFTPKSAVK